jgi:hypothetical protein
MSIPVGFLVAGVQLAAGALVTVKPKRNIGAVTGYATFEETHTDDLEITEHPIEQGASIADHAFKKPAELVLNFGLSNSQTQSGLLGLVNIIPPSLYSGSGVDQVKKIYEQLLQMQSNRELLTVNTGKRSYTNMLIKKLVTNTNLQNENTLVVTATFKQVILVATRTVQTAAPQDQQANPEITNPTTNQGTQQVAGNTNYNADAMDAALA